MNAKKKTEDKLIESIRKSKDVSIKDTKTDAKEPGRVIEDDVKEEKNESSKSKKTGNASVKNTTIKAVSLRSKRVWPD